MEASKSVTSSQHKLEPDIISQVEAEVESIKERQQSMVEIQSLPTREYLDQTVIPILLSALTALCAERPPDPIEYVAAYILKHKDEYDTLKK